MTAKKTPASAHAPKLLEDNAKSPKKKWQARKLNPEQIPWFDEGYTFSDRERELALLDDLLSARLADIRFQRQVIRQQIVTGDFGMPITDDGNGSDPVPVFAVDTDTESEPESAPVNNAGASACEQCQTNLGKE